MDQGDWRGRLSPLSLNPVSVPDTRPSDTPQSTTEARPFYHDRDNQTDYIQVLYGDLFVDGNDPTLLSPTGALLDKAK
ncbi:hypothetical protein V6N12_060324 [Hibiscus sabdariffa]|uniref:Uncharacterized protein n=1 Tax=Hibiscus sabdariffa TaxID=183260 RepID=A0ABR2D450_9ROSI